MTAIQFARITNARRVGGAWIARCPAHDDRRPSLSISEGRDARILVNCFAGCSAKDIAKAVGLGVADFFSKGSHRRRTVQRHPTRVWRSEAVEEALQAELASVVAIESARAGFDVAVLSRHRNRVRSIIERRLNVPLERELSPWYEIAPHSLDPAWLPCVDAAISNEAAKVGVRFETLLTAIEDMPQAQVRVLQEARTFQHSLCEEERHLGGRLQRE
jgi:hypothetical protein